MSFVSLFAVGTILLSGVAFSPAWASEGGGVQGIGVLDDEKGSVARDKEYEYDPVTGYVIAVFDPADKDGTIIRYGYDTMGNRTRITYPDGNALTHAYDDEGHLAETRDMADAVTVYKYQVDGALEAATQIQDGKELGQVHYTYDPLGRVDTLTRGNGLMTKRTYTAHFGVETETTRNAAGETVVYAKYTYNHHEKVETNTTTRTVGGTTGTDVTTYGYDPFGHLSHSHHLSADGTVTDTGYDVGVAGDVTDTTATISHPDGNVTTHVTGFQINDLHQAVTVTKDGIPTTQSFDGAGNVTRDHRGITYTYTSDNDLESATTAQSMTKYTYWVDGTRASATTHTADGIVVDSTRFYYTPSGELANDAHTRISAERGVTASYLLTPIDRQSRSLTSNTDVNADTGYYLHDQQGNIIAITNAVGAITAGYTSSDYGIVTTTRTSPEPTSVGGRNPFLYKGAYINVETDTYQMDVRTYDPTQMRFLGKDTEPNSHPYMYADGDPINFRPKQNRE